MSDSKTNGSTPRGTKASQRSGSKRGTASSGGGRGHARRGRGAAQRAVAGLTVDDLIDIYRTLYLSRRIDDREIALKRQNRIYFQISGAGHEVPQIVAGRMIRPGRDLIVPYYRDRALCLTVGMTPKQMFMQGMGAAADPSSGGRQMPSHWGMRELNIFASSSCTGTQFLHACGAAEVSRITHAVAELRERHERFDDDGVVLVCSGEGTTSEGEFWESMNTACNLKLPVVYLIQDNGYAISVPVEVQTAGGSISKLLTGFPNLEIIEVDGTDVFDTQKGTARAFEHARSGRGPALIHAHVVRPYSHSMSDNEAMYRTVAELEVDRRRDPFERLPKWLIEEGYATEAQIETIRAEVDGRILHAVDDALSEAMPAVEDVLRHIYSPDIDPCAAEFETEPFFANDDAGTMVDLLNDCLATELRRDPTVVVFGEDVADVSRDELLEEVKGKGGVFKVTHGLQREFGSARVFNTPLAEANIIGRAIGMASRGLKPVVEIQFFDYIWPAFQQLRNELANLRWRSNNDWSAPVVVRVPIGGYLKGGAPYHSQSGEVLFTHIPGLRVVMPSTALDANGLLRTAIRCDDPVMFLEPKHLYRQTYNKSPRPGSNFMIPFGKANIVRSGSHLTLVTYGSLVQRSLKAARALEGEGIDPEIIDLRTLSPYDWETIAESVRKTGKFLMVHEDHLSWGYGAEICARVSDELFEWLDGPVRRVGSLDSFVAYEPGLENAILPQVDDVEVAIKKLAEY